MLLQRFTYRWRILSSDPAVIFYWMLFAVSILLRLKHIHLPFDRDEGENAYAANAILSGDVPYRDFHNMKFPGTYYFYALCFFLFGNSIAAVRFGYILLTSVLICAFRSFISNQYNPRTGTVSAILFMLFLLIPQNEGLMANCEMASISFGIAGLWMMVHKSIRLHYFYAGILLALSAMMKQPGGIYILFAAYLFLADKEERSKGRNWIMLTVGGTILYVCLLVYLSMQHALDDFWYFTFQYGAEYGDLVPTDLGMYLLQSNGMPIYKGAKAFFIFGLVSLSLSLVYIEKSSVIKLWLFVLLSALAVVPGLYFRSHYFLYLLPAAALVAAVGFSAIASLSFPKKQLLILVIWLICLGDYLTQTLSIRGYLVSDATLSNTVYNGSVFSDSREIGNVLDSLTTESNFIGLLCNEPQLAYYANQRIASGYLYLYPMLEEQKYAKAMTVEWMQALSKIRPQFIVSESAIFGYTNDSTKEQFENWWVSFKNDYRCVERFVLNKKSGHFERQAEPNNSSPGYALEIWQRDSGN